MTFAAFLRQYESVPTRKLDGYSAGQFDGMTPEEQAKARTMLLDRALAEGDIFDLNGLRFIGDAGTVQRLAGMTDAADRFGWRFDIIRLEVLFVLTADPAWLHALTRWLDDRDPAAQERAADALATHMLPSDFAVTLAAILVERIADGRHEQALPGLLTAWLALRDGPGIDPMRFQRNLPLVRTVIAARPAARPALLHAAGGPPA